MADKKVTGMGANTTPDKDDLLHLINDPAGTPTNEKIKITDFATKGDLRLYGAILDGTTDDTTALTDCLTDNDFAYSNKKGWQLKVTSQIVLATGKGILGHGATSNNNVRGKSTIIRGFTGSDATILASGDDCWLDKVDIDNDDQGTGECVQVTGERFGFSFVSCRKSGGVGVRIGDTESGAKGFNANLGRIEYLILLNNADDGIRWDHTNTTTTGTFPLGTPSVNAWFSSHIDSRSNGADGINIGNSIDNTFVNAVTQTNTGYGIHLEDDARGHTFLKAYTESNTGATPSNDGELILDSGADSNVIISNRATVGNPKWTDNGAGNFIIQTNSNIANSEFAFLKNLNIYDDASNALPKLRFYADTGADLAAYLEALSLGTSGGGLKLYTKRDGNTPVVRVDLDEKGNVVINNAAIATNATDGFLYVPSCAGTPTGTPTTKTGMVPIVVDSSNNKLYFYVGSWRDAGP